MKTRSTKELLQIVLEQGNQSFEKRSDYHKDGYWGLCGFFDDLYDLGIINGEEHVILYEFLYHNKPKRANGPYYWEVRKWDPRKRWVLIHIKKLNSDN